MVGKDVKIKRQLNQKCSKSKKKKKKKKKKNTMGFSRKRCNPSVKDIKGNFQGGLE